MPIRLGLIGKTNTGKTTFFNAATLQQAEVSNYPFTTKTPNSGIAQVVTLCVHKEFGVEDNPRNSQCIDGWRFIPFELIDLPGLIKGAWAGKGLGNQFLAIAAQSDALLHIVDASGSVDSEGRIAEPGTGDPVADVADIEEELIMWYLKVLEGNKERITRSIKAGSSMVSSITDPFRGMGIKEAHVAQALRECNLSEKDIENWSQEEDRAFATALREHSKPTLIVANKMDLPIAAENFKRLQEEYRYTIVVPASSEAELTLRRAQRRGLIRYIPGEERFEIIEAAKLNEKQKWALNFIRKAVLEEYLRTGVQFAINVAILKLLRMNTVYPVYDIRKLSDKQGNVLPDVFLMPPGSTIADLAKEVHSELAKGLLYGLDARTGLHLPSNYILKDRDVLSIVSATKKA